jgi:hypothetical protein
MVRKTALLLAILLALCSCSFFTASLFPGYLAQAELGFDLSRQVDALLAGRSNPLRAELFVLRNNSTGEEFACLLLVVDYTPDRALFVVTPEGHLLQRNEPGLNGLHLTAADGRFVIGQVAYDPVTFTFAADLSVTPYQIWPEDTWKPAVSDGSSNFLFDVIWSTTLNYYEYKNDWSGRGSTPYALSLSSSYSNYELTRVFKDPDALCVPVVDCYLYPHTTISGEELDTRQVFYTRKGIAAVSYKGLLTLYDFNGNELSSMSLGQRKDLRFAFNLDGTHFYCFNLDDRRLYKGETGW